MRRLVTFVVRLWVDPQAQEPALRDGEGLAWKGQVECVGTDERAHVRGAAELARFIEAQMAEPRAGRPERPAGIS